MQVLTAPAATKFFIFIGIIDAVGRAITEKFFVDALAVLASPFVEGAFANNFPLSRWIN